MPSVIDRIDWSRTAADAAVGQLVAALASVDRLTAHAVEGLIRVVESGATEQSLGVAVEIVLSQTCRTVGFERTMLLRAATTLARMPVTRAAFAHGRISWSQVRCIVTAVRSVDGAVRDAVDELVAELAEPYADFEADALVHEVDWLVDRLVARRPGTVRPPRSRTIGWC